MFDNVMETSARPTVIDSESEKSEEPSPIKKPAPAPAKRKLGPQPASSKRKIVSSDSESSPVKKKVNFDSIRLSISDSVQCHF